MPRVVVDTPVTLSPTSQVAWELGRSHPFAFVGERLWLDFVNTDDIRRGERVDALADFEAMLVWMTAAAVLDGERAGGMRRRAQQQPAGASAALVDARRVRSALRHLAERGPVAAVRADALGEINRVLGRSAGTRRLEARPDGTFARSFVAVGDAFAGLMIPIVESAADSLIVGELSRVRRCSDSRCPRVFLDATKNGRRRWCDMARCGNRAKAARHRQRRGALGADGISGDAIPGDGVSDGMAAEMVRVAHSPESVLRA
jgi:predicted RNA-binding Zn ribbon-like protein